MYSVQALKRKAVYILGNLSISLLKEVERWFLRAVLIEVKKLILEMEIFQLPQVIDSFAEI